MNFKVFHIVLLESYMMLQLEILITGTQIDESFDETDNGRNSGPAEQKIQDAHADFSQIELVYPKTAQ